MSSLTTMSQLLKSSFKELQKSLYTSIPGHLTGFDASTQLAQIQIGVQRVDTNGNSTTPPPLIECPVVFPGGKYFIEYELVSGDEGIIMFSQRCIEGWLNIGGVADNPILRFHNINDAYFVPGLRSQANVIQSFQNNGVRLRNSAGDKYIWLKNDGNAEITAGTLTINGNVQINGTADSTGEGTFNGIAVSTHTHTQANDSGGNTEQPTGAPT